MKLKHKLEYHYKAFDRSTIEPDPLQFLHLFDDEKDIEVMGFIASVFAYGSVKQIINTLGNIVHLMNSKPYEFVTNLNFKRDLKLFEGIKHRFYSEIDISRFFLLLHIVYNENQSLKKLFLLDYDEDDLNTKNSISIFSCNLLDLYRKYFGEESRGIKFMFPLPEKGSACKRMNLFLRWMVRKDELDFGLWDDIPASKLVIPVDTHVAKISKQLNLTKRKNVNWKMAEEITNNLKKFDPFDPVKYDFAICHIGMRNLEF